MRRSDAEAEATKKAKKQAQDDSWKRPVTPEEATRLSKLKFDLKVIDGKLLTTKQLKTMKQPVLIKGLIDDWPSLNWTRDEFLDKHGQVKPSTRLNSRQHYYESNSLDAGEYLERQNHTGTFFRIGWGTVHTAVRDSYRSPKVLGRLRAVPIFSLVASAIGNHQHDATWLGQAVGCKAWILSSSDKSTGWDFNPCSSLLDQPKLPQGFLRCVVGPGDTLYLPELIHHGTCNLDEWTLAFGGLGWTDHCPKLFHDIVEIDCSHDDRLHDKPVFVHNSALIRPLEELLH